MSKCWQPRPDPAFDPLAIVPCNRIQNGVFTAAQSNTVREFRIGKLAGDGWRPCMQIFAATVLGFSRQAICAGWLPLDHEVTSHVALVLDPLFIPLFRQVANMTAFYAEKNSDGIPFPMDDEDPYKFVIGYFDGGTGDSLAYNLSVCWRPGGVRKAL